MVKITQKLVYESWHSNVKSGALFFMRYADCLGNSIIFV